MTAAVIDTPVVLIHGYGSSSACWCRVECSLRRAGFGTIRTMAHHPMVGDIPTLSARLVRLTHTLMAETGTVRVHLVGHSLGGLIIRYAVSVHGLDPLVDTAITVATPHRGCPFAWFGVGTVAAQCRPASAVLRRMHAAAPGQTRWVAYYADRDLLVPASSATGLGVLGAENVLLHKHDHLSILFSSRLARDITTRLAAAS